MATPNETTALVASSSPSVCPKGGAVVDTGAFDGLRGLAALCVGLFHLSEYTAFPVRVVGETAIPIFYVLSGFALELNYGGKLSEGGCSWTWYLQFMVRRLARFYPTYLLCNALVLPLYLPSTGSATSSLLLVTNWLPSGFFGSPPLLASWTISALFGLYAMFPILSRGLHTLDPSPGSAWRLHALSALAGTLYLVGGVGSVLMNFQGYYYNSALCASPVFLLGCCAGRQRRYHSQQKSQDAEAAHSSSCVASGVKEASSALAPSDICLGLMGTIFLVGSAALSAERYSWLNYNLLPVYLVPLPTYAAVLALTRPRAGAEGLFDALVLRSRAMRSVGVISMAFYLLHTVPLNYVVTLLPQANSSLLIRALCCASFVLAFPGAWVITHYFETPAARAILRLLSACAPGGEQ